jgi:midasin
MIRALASFVGVHLHEFSMNNDTDATDILGGYEQRDLHRQLNQKVLELQTEISALLSGRQSSDISLCGKLLTLLSEFPCSDQRLPFILSSFGEIVKNMVSLSSQLCDKLNHFGHLLVELGKESDTGKFQWYDGILVEAVTEGGWIVLDNANLCNPSVLDRLNSLLEPEGSLVLHESTNSNGEPRLLKPHPNFRLFLTVDARYGELSRAMRNRAIEVAVEAQNQETFLNCKKSVGIC